MVVIVGEVRGVVARWGGCLSLHGWELCVEVKLMGGGGMLTHAAAWEWPPVIGTAW